MCENIGIKQAIQAVVEGGVILKDMTPKTDTYILLADLLQK